MKLKCKKCGTRFNDRQDPQDSIYNKKLCFNCAFIVRTIGITIESLGMFENRKLNRDIILNNDDLIINKSNKLK